MQSLQEFDRPADRIRLHLQASSLVPLLVEGPSDVLVLKTHVRPVAFFPLNGRNNVLATIRSLVNAGIRSILGIVDRDFDSEDAFADVQDLLYPYDGVDLEGMLIDLGALSELLQHIGSLTKIEALGGSDAVVQSLRECIAPVSSLRLLSRREGLGLNFDEVNLQEKIDRKTLKLKVPNYCAALVGKTGLSPTELEKRALGLATDAHSGKDLAAAAGVALRHRAGSLPSAATVPSIITSQLRASSGLLLSGSGWIKGLVRRVSALEAALLAR
jgi:Protein of unknown function (DUF4435)